MRRKMAAGNWKMNGTRASLEMIDTLAAAHSEPACDIVICPPAQLLHAAAGRATGSVHIGAQNCHKSSKGAFTGDISVEMIADVGADHVIVGHSERREAYAETDGQVRDKAAAVQASGLTAIVCLGETLDEREAGTALDVIARQLKGSVPESSSAKTLVIAYEPIWAIGTGKIPSMEEIAEVHALMRSQLVGRFGEDGGAVRLLYGGSVKPANAAEIFALPDVDGALVGGASLKTDDFSPIIAALEAS